MGGLLSRFKFRWTKKQRLLFEVGIAVLCIILFIGALNVVTYTSRVPIVTTESLWKHADSVRIMFEFRNATDPNADGKFLTFSLADVAMYYNGYLYITIPYPAGFEVLRGIAIYNLTTVDGQVLTTGYMTEHGANTLYIYIEPINSTTVTFKNTFGVFELQLKVDSDGNSFIWAKDNVLLNVLDSTTASGADAATKWKALFPDNGTVNREVSIDLGTVAVRAAGYSNNIVGLFRFVGDIQGLEGFKLKLALYAVSEKPVLKALTEPIYSVVSGLWAALLAFWRRFKTIVGSAFGGFSLSALFTGLIGDPVTAMVLSIAMITILFLVMKKHR